MIFFRKILTLILGIFILHCNNCKAAFIIKNIDSNYKKQAISKLTEPEKTTFFFRTKRAIHNFIFSYNDRYHKYEYVKDFWVAVILCFPYFGGLLGIGRFYMEYNWQGLVQLASLILTIALYLIYYYLKSYIAYLILIPVASCLVFCGFWEIVDVFRILLGTLKPKYGDWK